MKRYTETTKWQDPWFRKLSGPAKLLWFFLIDSADPSGVLEIDYELATEDCKIKITPDHMKELGSRVQLFGANGEKVLIPKFIPFQYGSLSDACFPHKRVFEAIRKHGLVEELDHTYRHPGGFTAPPKKEASDEKPKVAKDELAIPADLPAEVTEALALWKRHRREIKKAITPTSWQSLITDCRNNPKRMAAAINISIKNGWQGLFPDKVDIFEDASAPSNKPAWLPDNWREIANRVMGEEVTLGSHADIPADFRYAFEAACREVKGREAA